MEGGVANDAEDPEGFGEEGLEEGFGCGVECEGEGAHEGFTEMEEGGDVGFEEGAVGGRCEGPVVGAAAGGVGGCGGVGDWAVEVDCLCVWAGGVGRCVCR